MRTEMEIMHKVLFRAAHAEAVGASTPFPLPRPARRAAAPQHGREATTRSGGDRTGGLMRCVLFRVALAEERTASVASTSAASTSVPDMRDEMTEMIGTDTAAATP
jgi:hypothetical protein